MIDFMCCLSSWRTLKWSTNWLLNICLAISHCWYATPRQRPFGLNGKIFFEVLHNQQLRAQDVK